MSMIHKKYCLDANALIVAWEKYYAPEICPAYWEILDQLGTQGRVFLPAMVFQEVLKIDDGLARWLKSSIILLRDLILYT